MEIRLTTKYFFAVFFYLLTAYSFVIYTYNIEEDTGYANQNKNNYCWYSHPARDSLLLLFRFFSSGKFHNSGERRLSSS